MWFSVEPAEGDWVMSMVGGSIVTTGLTYPEP